MNSIQTPDTVTEEPPNYCPRHPSIQTNLRCGRCGQLICPRCLVNSPVGARCPDCARIGRPKIMDAGAGDLGRAAIAAIGGGLVAGVLVSLVIRVLIEIAFLGIFGQVIVAAMLLGAGVPLGELVRRASNRSMDNRVRMLAGSAVFIVYVVAVPLTQLMNVTPAALLNLFGYIGLAMGIWTAMQRVRQ